jgi:uncharacterized protein (TIGR03435 family)
MTAFAASLLLKVTAILLLAIAASLVLRRQRAAVRHVVVAAAFAALLVVPAVSLIAPAVLVALPIASSPRAIPAAADLAPGVADTLQAQRHPFERVATTRASSAVWPSWTALAAATWALGALLCLAPVIAGLWQIRALRRTGLPWRRGQAITDGLAGEASIARPIGVLLHESVAGPMTCGVARPLIVLPADARQWPDADVQRAIVHELEHVRRGDWISHCLARAACGLYWFHPLVWIARRTLSLEAERACDDAVVGRTEATAYADQLIVLAERLSSAAHPPALAMASRHDLAARVQAVLDSTQPRGRAGGRWLVAAGAAAALMVTAMAPIRVVAVARTPAQAAAPSSARFSAVSMKPCSPEPQPPGAGGRGRGGGGGNVTASPGSVHIDCSTVQSLIDRAYVFFGEPLLNESGPPREDTPRIKGGPAWLRSEKYTIEATADGAAKRETMLGPMLRAFLEERLQLQLHRETEDLQAYALTVAKGGLRIQPIGEGGCTPYDPDRPHTVPGPLPAGGKPTCGLVMHAASGSMRMLDVGGMELKHFAELLKLDRPIVDRTGIDDRFNIHFDYASEDAAADPDSPGPNVFRALEQQLGLKLEPIKTSHGIIVVDKAVRPW